MQPSDLKQKIQQLLGDPKYRPSRASELIGKLKIPPERRGEVKKILSQLINEGKIVQIKKDRLVLPAEADLVSGRLQMNERGFGFVIPDEPKAGDIYISAENIGVAMHGDLVVCRLNRGRREKPGVAPRRDGRIIRILKRANTTIVGTLQKTNLFYHVIPDEPRIIQDIYVTPPGKGEKEVKANVGDKVVVKLEPWESRHVNPEGHIIEVLGRPNDPHIDIISIIRKHHLPTSFPQEVLDEAAAFSPEVPAADIAGREDLRDQLVFTIDPEDARDFDDAISGDARPGGGWRLGVHIADVSHYVQPGTALDREARLRGNSVYLPDRVLPMLPEKLSNGLCSLNPNVARLTKSVFFEIDAQGNVESFRFAETVIHSRYRLSYPEALRHLQGKGGSEIAEKLQELWRLASLLRRNRFAAGSLDLEFPEIKVICDEQGRAVRIEKREYDISHQFIEEFMLLANEAVAASTQRDELPSLYRVHEDPDPEKLNDYRDFVMTYGYKAGDLSQRRELQSLIKQYQGSPEEYVLKLNLLKSLKRAAYEEHPKGHYGLAKENYTHFTSPIRRYADLVVHRVVASNLREKKRAPYSMAELADIAAHISDTERVAAEAESEAVKLKQIEFFERQLNAKGRKKQTFAATIVDIRNFGLFIELPDLLLTGLVHISTLHDDFYKFDATRLQIFGKKSGRVFKIGQPVIVQPARVDRFKRQIDFVLAEASGTD